MKKITVTAHYPELVSDEIFDSLAAGFDWNEEKHGDKLKYVENSLQVRFHDLLKATYHIGYRKKNNIPDRPPITNPEGFGDTLAIFIDKWINNPMKRFFNWLSMNCGCDGRRKWLNKHFPYDTNSNM
jgi:hypothetical protein